MRVQVTARPAPPYKGSRLNISSASQMREPFIVKEGAGGYPRSLRGNRLRADNYLARGME